MNLTRQRSHVVYARHGKQLTDLLKADLGISTRDHGTDWLACDSLALRPDLIRDSETLKHLMRQINAAGGGGIRDRSRFKERAFECVDSADVRHGCSCPHRHADAGSYQVNAAARDNLPLLDQCIERVGGQDHDVHGFATLEPARNGVRRVSHRSSVGSDDLVVGRAFKLWDELKIWRRKGAGGHDSDFLRACRTSKKQNACGEQRYRSGSPGRRFHDGSLLHKRRCNLANS